MISEGQRASAPPPTFPSDVVSTSKMWLQRLCLTRASEAEEAFGPPTCAAAAAKHQTAAGGRSHTRCHEVSNLNAQMSTRQSSQLQYRIGFKKNGNPHLHNVSGNNKKKIPRKYSTNEEPKKFWEDRTENIFEAWQDFKVTKEVK